MNCCDNEHRQTQQVSTVQHQDRNDYIKRKPKQIIVEYRDAETNQIVQKIVDKVSKKRITPLKKAILKKRTLEKQHRLLRKEERRRLREIL